MFVGLLAVALVCGATLLAGLLTCVFFFFCWVVKFCTGYCEASGCCGLKIEQCASKVVLIRPQAGPAGCVWVG